MTQLGASMSAVNKKAPGLWQNRRSFEAARDRIDDLRKEVETQNSRSPFARFPVDSVDYYQARACLKWQRKELPTLQQWWLAARGPVGDATRWPWGAEWSKRDKDRNGRGYVVPVTRGGHARRSAGGKSVHHLSGNVAEWLARPKFGKVFELVGGTCHDEQKSRVEKMRLYAGELTRPAKRTAAHEGFGFRGVLAVGSYFQDLAPADD